MPSNTFERTRQQIKQGDAKVSIKDDLKLRLFEFLVAYDGVVWVPGMKTSGIHVSLVYLRDTHTTPLYATRNSNGLSLGHYILCTFLVAKLKQKLDKEYQRVTNLRN